MTAPAQIANAPDIQPSSVKATTQLYLRGSVGVGTYSSSAQFKDLQVSAGTDPTPGETLLKSDLSKGTSDWSLSGGQWKVVDGTLQQSSTTQNCRAIVGDPAWTDYTLTMKAKKLSGNEGFLVLFRIKDATHFAWFNAGGWGNTKTQVELTADDTRTPVGSYQIMTITPNQWYDVKIEVKGDLAKCYLDGKLICQADISGAPGTQEVPHNSVGVGTYSTISQFKDVQVVNASSGTAQVGGGGAVLLKSDLSKGTEGWAFLGAGLGMVIWPFPSLGKSPIVFGMTPLLFTLSVVGISIFAGFLGSLLGIGGGIVVTPALTLLLGIDIRYAIGASLVSVIATSSGAAAAYVRERMANIRVAMLLEIGTTSGALAGAYLAGYVGKKWLYVIFGLMLGYSSLVMLRQRRDIAGVNAPRNRLADRLRLHDTYYDQAAGREIPYRVTHTRTGLVLMVIAGAVSGLLGIGSGSLKVPAMDLAMRLPIKVSTATSNFMMGVTAAASAGIYFARGDINPFIAAPVAAGVLVGATLGSRLLGKIQSHTIRMLFVIVLLLVSAQMLWKGIRS